MTLTWGVHVALHRIALRCAVLCCAVQVNTWRTATETCTKEKDFYYSKLRAIELLCNTPGVSGHPVSGNGFCLHLAGTSDLWMLCSCENIQFFMSACTHSLQQS
jgi:hypothetical protein